MSSRSVSIVRSPRIAFAPEQTHVLTGCRRLMVFTGAERRVALKPDMAPLDRAVVVVRLSSSADGSLD